MIRVAIDTSALTGGHSVRGIGVMVGEEINEMKSLKDKSIKLDAFDFQSAEGKQKLINGKYDVVHYPYFFPYEVTVPEKKSNIKVVVTIQDLIQLVYPKKYPPGFRGTLNFIRQRARLKNVDAVLTISETSKKDIVRFLHFPTDNIHVVYLAPQKGVSKVSSKAALSKIKKKYSLPDEFVLYIGDVNYNKNIPGLIRACKLAKIPLVIVGKHAADLDKLDANFVNLKGPKDWLRFLFGISHPELAHFSKLADEFKHDSNILRLGYVGKEEFTKIFKLASVYVQPSFYEGFGLPVLEAFREEVPVVISKTNALVEIAGGAALIADPKDSKDMAEKITEVLDNNKTGKMLIAKGKDRLKNFSWKKTAKEMVEVYKTVAEKS